MDAKTMAVLVTIGFSLVGVVGDTFLKHASDKEHSLKSAEFYIGFVIYASTAFGWVFVMKHLKLAQVGVIYCVSMVLLLTAIGTLRFKETLNGYEIAGIAMAVGSLVLLAKHINN
jgi:drug/metabolite transporter (DMT)-like permease